MSTGLVYGKFAPPHRGHEDLLEVAARSVDRLVVLVTAARWEAFPLASKERWLRLITRHHGNVEVMAMPCDLPFDLTSEAVWEAHVAGIRAALAHASKAVDVLFTSEPYGDDLAVRLGCTHVSVDEARSRHRVSSSRIRAGLFDEWDQLPDAVARDLAARVVVLGAESTGTTTVSVRLAEDFRARGGAWARTAWVAEYGRQYTAEKWDGAREAARRSGSEEPALEQLVWHPPEFETIAVEQRRREQAAATAPLVVCDTDNVATRIWQRRYAGTTAGHAWDVARPDGRPPVYLVTDHKGVPWVDDGLRDGAHVRAEMTGWFVEHLTATGASWVLLTGPLEERVDLARRVVDLTLDDIRDRLAGAPRPGA